MSVLACDWGTTNLRAWVVGDDGRVIRSRDFPLGVSKLAPGEAAKRFRDEVRPGLVAEDMPAILCGMIGSTLGWAVADYLPCPAGADEMRKALLKVEGGKNPVHIVPGLRCAGLTAASDVMRGEETQAVGWVAEDPARREGRFIVCHPGTHAKWIEIVDGKVTRFVTAMTGELFAVLGRHSVLKTEHTPDDPAAFDDGLKAAGDGGALASRLFSARARIVADGRPDATTASYLSGLLIGAETASAPGLLGLDADTPIALIGEPHLCRWYARALGARPHTIHNGDQAALAGLAALNPETVPLTLDEALAACPVVAIIRGVTPDEVLDIGDALFQAGIRGVEVPLNSPDPIRSIHKLAGAFGGRMVVAAGTVLTPARVDEVIEAGGRIIVSPNTNPAVIARTLANGAESLPGIATPTDAFAALDAGAHHLKLFPASTYGPGHVRQIRAVLPAGVTVWAVGGVGADDFESWWAAGVDAFGLGSELYKPGMSAEEVFDRAKTVVATAAKLT